MIKLLCVRNFKIWIQKQKRIFFLEKKISNQKHIQTYNEIDFTVRTLKIYFWSITNFLKTVINPHHNFFFF